jgi:hypothetical protein
LKSIKIKSGIAMKITEIKTLCKLQDFILYGDLHKVPTSALGSHWDGALNPDIKTFSNEQILRMKVAAAIEIFMKNNKYK